MSRLLVPSPLGRYRQLVRCLRLLRVVDGYRRVDVDTLAKNFDVSTRTIRRDLAALRSAGERVMAGDEGDLAL